MFATSQAIRPVVVTDAESISAIYAHHVRHGSASFDTIPLSAEETRSKIARITGERLPFLAAVDGADLLGYAYATRFRDRPAYGFTCEDSIYIDPQATGRGVGTRLLAALIDAATTRGFRQMIAVIGGGEPASVALHAKLGFAHAGTMRSVGRKFGAWRDTVYMQRPLGEGDESPPLQEPV